MKYKFIKNLLLLGAFYIPIIWIPKGIFLNPIWMSILFGVYIINNIIPNKRMNYITSIFCNIVFLFLTIFDIIFFVKQMTNAIGEAAFGIIIIFFDFIFLIVIFVFMILDFKQIKEK